jgi:branched-chain amino acid transport system ATP-binding protein
MSAGTTLIVEGLCAGYGRMPVVLEASLRVEGGQVVALVGRNGAGKTTLLKAIAGLREGSNAGSVRLGDVDISSLPAERIGLHGLALVPEGHRLFPGLTVLENLRLGFFPWRRSGRRRLGERLDRVFDLFPILREFAERRAQHLSGGQQQMVAIGQALMADPRVLLLDEPSSGLAPAVVADIYAVISTLRDSGVAVLVVEQNLDRALASADFVYVLDRGRVALSGAAAELAADGRVGAVIHGLDAKSESTWSRDSALK